MERKRITEADKMVYLERLSEFLEKSSYMEEAVPLLIEINSLLLKIAHKVSHSFPDEDTEGLLSSAESFHKKVFEFMRNRRDLDSVDVDDLKEWLEDMKLYKEKASGMLEELSKLSTQPKLLK